VECYKCGEEGHKYKECLLWKKVERVAHPVQEKAHQQEKRKPVRLIKGEAQKRERKLRRVEEGEAARPVQGEAQQEWKRSSMEELRKRVEEHCGKGVLEKARFLELEWYTPELIVIYNKCRGYGRKGSYAEDNRGQGVLQNRTFWYGYKGKKEENSMPTERKSAARVEIVVQPREAKAQQGSTWSGELESTAKEEVKERDIRRTFKILREVWLDIGIEKVDMHEGVIVKALLDSGATGMFMDREMAKRHGFKITKLEKPLKVKNVDGTENSGGNIIHQVEVNVFYKNHVERMKMDVCNLEKTEVILGMPWLQVYNPEINWETGEVKMTRCPPLCGRNLAVKEDIERRKKIGKRIRNIEKVDRNEWKWTMEEKFNKEIELDREKVKEMVP